MAKQPNLCPGGPKPPASPAPPPTHGYRAAHGTENRKPPQGGSGTASASKIVYGTPFLCELAKAFGLTHVRRIRIDAAIDDVTIVHAEQYVTDDQGEKVVQIVTNRYELQPLPDAPKPAVDPLPVLMRLLKADPILHLPGDESWICHHCGATTKYSEAAFNHATDCPYVEATTLFGNPNATDKPQGIITP